MAGVPKSWCLWTVWSSELGALMDTRGLTTNEFATEIIAAVQEKDSEFKIRKDEDIQVIRPTKLLDIDKNANTGTVRVEIGGVVFRPGTRNDEGGFGKRWRLIACNKLAVVFLADKNFSPYKLCNEMFVIINGKVLDSERQIWMDDHDRDTKIIRLINEQIRSGTDDRYSNVSHEFRNYWKHRGSSKHAVLQVTPYSALLNEISLEREMRKRLLPADVSVDELPPSKVVRTCTNSTARITTPSTIQNNVPESTTQNRDISSNNSREGVPNAGRSEAAGKEQLTNDLNRVGSFSQMEINLERPGFTDNKSSKLVSKPKDRSPSANHYHKLSELERDLTQAYSKMPKSELFRCLKKLNVYGIVDEVIQLPKEKVKKGESQSYLLRISDETKSNVLVRLCTAVRGLKNTVFHEVGPAMASEDIIRIHRATVQFETSETGSKELVVSTSAHLNYTVFNNDTDIDAPIKYERLAKGTEALKDGDDDIIRNLRRFSAARRVASRPDIQSRDSSAEDIFYDTRSHVSSDESFEANQSIEEYGNVMAASVEGNDEILGEECHSDDESEMVIMIPESETSGGSESDDDEGSKRNTLQVIDQPLNHGDTIKSTSTVSCISLHDCETKESMVLQGRICNMIEVLDEDTIFVSLTDGTKPALNFERLIEDEGSPISQDPHCVDIAIRRVSENVEVRRAIMNQIGSNDMVFRNVKVLKQQSDKTSPMFQLFAEAKTICMES